MSPESQELSMKQNREYKQQENRLNELASLRSSLDSSAKAPYFFTTGLLTLLWGANQVYTYIQSSEIPDLHYGLAALAIGGVIFAFGKHLYCTSEEEIKGTLKISHPTLLSFISLHADKLRQDTASSKRKIKYNFKRSSSAYDKECRYLEKELNSSLRSLRVLNLKILEHMDQLKQYSDAEIHFSDEERKLVSEMIDDRIQEYIDINLDDALNEVVGKEDSYRI